MCCLRLCCAAPAAQQSLRWVLARAPLVHSCRPLACLLLPLACAAPACRPERIRPIAERYELDADAVLDNVVYARAHTYEQQFGGCCPPALLRLGAKLRRVPCTHVLLTLCCTGGP